EAEPLRDARTETFDQYVGLVDQTQHYRARLGALQVERDRASVARADIELGGHAHAESARFDAVDAHNIRTEVGEQHRAHRAGADAGEFDDTQAGKWAHEGFLLKWFCLGAFNASRFPSPPSPRLSRAAAASGSCQRGSPETRP